MLCLMKTPECSSSRLMQELRDILSLAPEESAFLLMRALDQKGKFAALLRASTNSVRERYLHADCCLSTSTPAESCQRLEKIQW